MRAIRVGPGPKGFGVMSDTEVLLLAGLTQVEAVETVREADNVEPGKRGRQWVPAIRMEPHREDSAADVDYTRKFNRSIAKERAMRESQ